MNESSSRSAERQADRQGSKIAADPRFRGALSEGGLHADLGAVAESYLGVGLDNVRLRADAQAQHNAESNEALAVTVGAEISFGLGQLTADDRGRQLLAHELVHVAQ